MLVVQFLQILAQISRSTQALLRVTALLGGELLGSIKGDLKISDSTFESNTASNNAEQFLPVLATWRSSPASSRAIPLNIFTGAGLLLPDMVQVSRSTPALLRATLLPVAVQFILTVQT
jgi:hypothetical protein